MTSQNRKWAMAIVLLFVLGIGWKLLPAPDAGPPAPPPDEPELSLTETTTNAGAVARSAPRFMPGAPSLEIAVGASPLEKAMRIRSEMKLSLSGIYAAQRAFFTESGRYTTDFDVMGWMPTVQKLSAKVGFLYPFQPPQDEFNDRPDRFDTDQLVESSLSYEDPDSHFSYAESATDVSMRSLGSFCEASCSADANHFEVIAAANLDDDEELDVWRINDRKELTHVFDDLAGTAIPGEIMPEEPVEPYPPEPSEL